MKRAKIKKSISMQESTIQRIKNFVESNDLKSFNQTLESLVLIGLCEVEEGKKWRITKI